MQVVCPSCETRNPATSLFCCECGAPLEPVTSPPEPPTPAEEPKKRRRWPAILGALAVLCVTVIISAALLGGLSDGEATHTREALAEGTQGLQATEPAAVTKPPEPTIPATATPQRLGMSRSHPLPRTEVVSAPGWDVRVLETVRGDAAWQALQAANRFNKPAPEGMEYLLVKLHVLCTYEDSEEHLIGAGDFRVTGDRYERYFPAVAVEPEPQLDATLYSGGETEGWASYLVGQEEGNLILIIDELMSFVEDRVRTIALDEGASVSIPADLSGIEPTDLGTDRDHPAPLGETVTTKHWQVTLLEVVRGDEAWLMVQEANEFNDPPAEGMEYIAVHVQARNISTEDSPTLVDGTWFRATGIGKVLYDWPIVVDPSPVLECDLFPGGECQGWVTLQATQGETGLAAVFEPLFELFGGNQRFLSLEP
jgi:hypothetical protein